MSFDFEHDPTVPFWRSDVEVQSLFKRHGYDGPRVDAWLVNMACEPDEVRAYGPVAEMRGRFVLGILNGRCHHFTFTPDGLGRGRAIVFPIFEGETMVDLLAISKHDERAWGTVTGRGLFAGSFTTDAPLRVYRSAWRWLLWGCQGVLPLDKEALVQLQAAPQLITETVEHAEDLAERVWINPAWYDRICSIEEAEENAAARIVVDGTEEDVDREIRAEWRFAA